MYRDVSNNTIWPRCIEYVYRGARSIHVFGIGEIHEMHARYTPSSCRCGKTPQIPGQTQTTNAHLKIWKKKARYNSLIIPSRFSVAIVMAPKKKDGKKKDAKKKEEEVPYVPPKPLAPATTNVWRHNEFFFEPNDRQVVHTRGYGESDAAIGDDVLEYGTHRFAITLQSHGHNTSAANYLSGIVVGVTEAEFEATDGSDPYRPGGGKAWGISFPSRRLAVTQNCYKRGELGCELCPRDQGGPVDGMVLHFELGMGPELQHTDYGRGGQLAARMVSRTMWVAVNDGPFVECCRSLPATVRVWALLASEGDAVTLTPATRHRKVSAPGSYIP